MAQLGADVEQLDALSTKFNQIAEQIQQLSGQLDGQVKSAWWQGSDADKFRGDWDGNLKGSLTQVSQRLQQTSQQVKQQANTQRQTSQA